MNVSVLVISMAAEIYGWGHRDNVLTASYYKVWKDYSLILLIEREGGGEESDSK